MSTDHLQPNQRMRPGVKALIVHEDKILMIHEKITRDGEVFEIVDFPGGGLDFGEGLKAALVREVKEELCLDITVGKVVGAWDFVIDIKGHDDNEARGVHIVCIGYQCELAEFVEGEPKIDLTKNPAEEDIFKWGWYTKKELLANNSKLLRSPGMKEAVLNLEM
jgi:ADP-ribose pyrophosphatase YjhB (NUDIX family)